MLAHVCCLTWITTSVTDCIEQFGLQTLLACFFACVVSERTDTHGWNRASARMDGIVLDFVLYWYLARNVWITLQKKPDHISSCDDLRDIIKRGTRASLFKNPNILPLQTADLFFSSVRIHRSRELQRSFPETSYEQIVFGVFKPHGKQTFSFYFFRNFGSLLFLSHAMPFYSDCSVAHLLVAKRATRGWNSSLT